MSDGLIPRRPTTPVARAGDFSTRELQRLLKRGIVERAARGVYLSHEAARSPHRELLVVAARVPRGVFCLLTALAFHGLTTEMPHEVWIAVGLKARSPVLATPPLRIVRLSNEPLHEGVEIHREHDIELHVFCAAKSVAGALSSVTASAWTSPLPLCATGGKRIDSRRMKCGGP